MARSRAELKIGEILDMNEITYKTEFSFKELVSINGRPLRFDFVVFTDEGDIDFIIEYQGKQHFQPCGAFGGNKGYYQQVYNDNKKRRFCTLNYVKLVEIPYTEENLIDYNYIMKKAGY